VGDNSLRRGPGTLSADLCGALLCILFSKHVNSFLVLLNLNVLKQSRAVHALIMFVL
jgi:hypothetical protein